MGKSFGMVSADGHPTRLRISLDRSASIALSERVWRSMRRYLILWVGLSIFCLIPHLSWADTAYVTDSFKITLRTGPSTENKVTAMLSSGERLEILEAMGEWAHVQVDSLGAEQKEGWVLSRYLIRREPWELQAKKLLEKSASLNERMALAEKKWTEAADREGELQQNLKQATETLDKVQTDYRSLKEESSDFLRVKGQAETLQSSLQNAQQRLETLTEENQLLKQSQQVKWFLAGALVFLGAGLIGLVIGRKEKKRRGGLAAQWKR
jgi:SH3 domain protein